MTQRQIALAALEKLPRDTSLDEIADRIEFSAVAHKGLAELDQGEGIPHNEIKKQVGEWLAS